MNPPPAPTTTATPTPTGNGQGAGNGGNATANPAAAPPPPPAANGNAGAAQGPANAPANVGPPAYAPTFFNGQLPAPTGDVATTISRTPLDVQRQQAMDFYTFLRDPNADLANLNHPGQCLTALISVPNSHLVKLIYGFGYGTSGIGQVSPIANKILALHGEGGGVLGTPPVLVLEPSIKDDKEMRNPTDAGVEAAFQSGNHNIKAPVSKAKDLDNSKAHMLRVAPIPAYLTYDAFNGDVDAALVYERLRDCQHASPMMDHALTFLRTCMVGQWRQSDAKPFLTDATFTAMPPIEARHWASQRFSSILPQLAPQANGIPLPPQPQGPAPQQPVVVQHGAGGAAGPVFNLDAAALQQFFQLANQQGASAADEEKKEDSEMKVSQFEKARMRVMCGLEPDSEAFPRWFKDLFSKHQTDTDKTHIITAAVRDTWFFDDAEVPLYPTLLKMILKRDWTASDMGIRASYVNAAKGLSPFAMIEFTLEDIAVMTEDYQDMSTATSVSASDLKSLRSKLAASVPEDGQAVILMLQRFANLIFALFTSQSPMYKQLYKLIKALKRFSLNARKNMPHRVKASILWIVLLQARRFSMGNMIAGADDECLGEFSNLLGQLWAMSTAGISHEDLPDELKKEPGSERKRDRTEDVEDKTSGPKNKGPSRPGPKREKSIICQPWAKELKDALTQPLMDAGKPTPGVSRICKYCGVTPESLVPDFDHTRDCRQHLVLGNCKWGDNCSLNHRMATKEQSKIILQKFERFIKDPMGLPPIDGGTQRASAHVTRYMPSPPLPHRDAKPTPHASPMAPPQYQSYKEKMAAIHHAKEVFAPPEKLALTPGEQQAAIREAFVNDESVPRNPDISRAQGKIPSLVIPQKEALEHAAGQLLDYYATHGCPVDCGEDWTLEHIEAAILHGAHPSADSEAALTALHTETREKEKNGYARVVRYGDIKKKLPKKLKISPVAMIPHKSRLFRTILDLSFKLRLKGRLMQSVNSATVKQAPAESMVQLGLCIQRIVSLLADNYDPNHPFKFAKLDIKDGFWRMAVSPEDAWNFCYVLPQFNPTGNIDDTLLVVPSCLQMGWCESPPFFCAASETARDVIDTLRQELSLPSHPFENAMMREAEQEEITARLQAATTFHNIVEVFVDDFIGVTNNIDPDHLRHFSRAMLYGVHSVFPPPDVTGHHGEDPVSQKKLKQGEGTWSYEKEILGWLINGANFTIQLMPEKCVKVANQIDEIKSRKFASLKSFQELAGKLQHASFAIPGGKGLFSAINQALTGSPKYIKITEDLRETLKDWKVLVQHLATCPTPVQLLVSDYPNLIQYTDACKLGAGGVIVPGMDPSYYYVWQYEWPEDIRKQLVSWDNPTGTLTINDLELGGMVLGWLVIEYICGDLRFKHVGSFCDNTSAVAWSLKGSTATSLPAARLLRFLALRQRIRQVSSLLPMNIAGKDNRMADIPSRAFKHGEFFHAHQDLVSYFNSHFPLPQNASWVEYKIPPKLASRVISCLRGELWQMGSLLRLPKLEKSIGRNGQDTVPNATSLTRISKTLTDSSKASSSCPLQPKCGPGLSVEEIKSVFKQSRMHSRPSPRPANWLENAVPSSKVRENTFFPSSES